VPELGLFPLPIVLVPTERIPLHIFEPRYRELIDECVENGEDFGFVLATGDGAVHEIGTRAAVAQVLEVLEDGSMNIVIEGRERFRLVDLTTGRSFTTGPRSKQTSSARRRPSASSPRQQTATSMFPIRNRRSSTSSWRRASTSASSRSRSCSR
jgi:Lon protease-like protein